MLNLTVNLVNVFLSNDIWVLERRNRASVDKRKKLYTFSTYSSCVI